MIPSKCSEVKGIIHPILERVDDVRVGDGLAGHLDVPKVLVVLLQRLIHFLIDSGSLFLLPGFLQNPWKLVKNALFRACQLSMES